MSYEVILKVILNPVWKTGPKVCATTLLPAFETAALLGAFLATNAPGCKVKKIIVNCPSCGMFHAETSAPVPSGGSSGTGRDAK